MNPQAKRRVLLLGSASVLLVLAALAGSFGAAGAPPDRPGVLFQRPWSFGVMGDTQWVCSKDPAGQNPNSVSVSIINQVNQQFIQKGVQFVIQVGDLTDNGTDAAITTRAQAAQALLLAGIGFFPMRGNHETYDDATADDASTNINSFGIPAFQNCFPQTRGIGYTFGAHHFSSPTDVSVWLDGMTYSFDYNNARFVILDDWVTPDSDVAAAGYDYGWSIAQQQAWISGRLDKTKRRPEHAFVFTHHNLIGENHQDCLFQGYTNANPDMQNAFFASLQNNGVRYYISGHDHTHQRSLIASPDGLCRVQELICASNSSKFYTPKALTDPNWFGQKVRETSLSQELYTVGFYIYTVDGPRVTVDYYSDDHGNWLSGDAYPANGLPNQVTPTFNFVKKEIWSYSLNGKEFAVAQGGTYTVVKDRFERAAAQILSGTNTSTAMDHNNRPLTQLVDTGWAEKNDKSLSSDILSLTGMAKTIGNFETPIYVLSMSYEKGKALNVAAGNFGLATLDEEGHWVNAVTMNLGDASSFNFVNGSWNSGYGLGTYGVDPQTGTAWAVLNYNGEFAVANGLDQTKRRGK